MNYGIIGEYPSPLNDDQVKCYVSVLLCVADVDGISSGEMNLIRDLAADANVPSEIVEDCINSYKTFDLGQLPDYNLQWANCILRDAILIADCDDGISAEESAYLKQVANYAGIESNFEKIKNLTLSTKANAEAWESLLAESV